MARNKILFYSSVSDKRLFEIQRFYKIDIEILESLGYIVITSNKIFDALKFWRYNAVFIYFYKYGLFVAVLAGIFFKKVYFTGGIDELDEHYAGRKLYLRQKLFFKLCRIVSTRCIIVSSADRENIIRAYNGRLPGKLAFSEHTIDVDSFSKVPSVKSALFTTVGWMQSTANVTRKGIDKSLRLFAYLINQPEFAQYKFIIIGKKGNGSELLEQMAIQMGISDKITFTDAISEREKIDILVNSQYYFQLSQYEGFGIAALEALVAGNVVIHSGKGGLNDTIQNFGILANINAQEDEEFARIYYSLRAYDTQKIDSAQKVVFTRFANERRACDFSKIIKIS